MTLQGDRRRKVDAHAVELMLELARAGQTHTAIALHLEDHGVKVTAKTVGQYLAKAEIEGRGVPRRKRTDPRAPRKPQDALSTSPAPTGPPADEIDWSDPLGVPKRRLVDVRQMISASVANGNTTNFASLCKLEADLAIKIEAARPPPPEDPEKDPMYVKARERLLKRIERLVEQHERTQGTA